MLYSLATVGLLAFGFTAFAQDGGASSASAGTHPRVKLETTLGDIVLELDGDKAPISTLNFIDYAQSGFYNGTIFHRVMANFMIQGGGFTPEVDEKKEGLRDPIKNEWQNGLKNVRGTIAMARTQDPDSASAQFFINVVDNGRLDQPISGGAGYAVFGKVVEGMDVVDKIKDTPVISHPKYPSPQPVTPETPVVIKNVSIVGEFDRAAVEAVIAAAASAQKTEAEGRVKLYQEALAKGTKSDTGLITHDLSVGSGEQPAANANVDVHYTGWLTDGTKFDSSRDRGKPFTFNLRGGVIKGWLEGVATMKVGGKRVLVIPPELGYGQRGAGAVIPPNATLVFEVELLGIK